MRRTNWLPVDFGANKKDQETRSALSVSEEEVGDFEDYEPSEDEWDEWDMDVEEAYEEAGDADWEDSSWKDLLSAARDQENDLNHDAADYDEAGDSDWDDSGWKNLLTKSKKNDDLPDDDEDLSDCEAPDENMTQEDLSEDEHDPPQLHKIATAMMEARGTYMSDLST